jgi:hypothetical protein
MTQVPLQQTTIDKIDIALNQGPGTNNANYVAAYNAIYRDISNTALNSGTQYWFSQAGNVNGQAFTPSAAGTYIWTYTQAAAAAEGYTVTTTNLQMASDAIALQVFRNLERNSFVLTDDETNQFGFSPEQIVANDAGAGISYL